MQSAADVAGACAATEVWPVKLVKRKASPHNKEMGTSGSQANDGGKAFERRIAERNQLTFFREFTFSENGFRPTPGTNAELADAVVWMGDYCLIQMKDRSGATDDPEAERRWFDRNILGKAIKQIRDGLGFLSRHVEISIRNERGHAFDLRGTDIKRVDKVVLYDAAKALPVDRRRMTHYVSRTAGFVHIFAVEDYLGILEVLVTPGDIRRYLEYREEVLQRPDVEMGTLNEAAIVGHYVGGDPEARPEPDSVLHLGRVVDDQNDFDLTPIVVRLVDHVIRSAEPRSYYRIMLELAQLPRSVARQFKLRFSKAVNTARDRAWAKPYLLYFPETDCAFMVVAMHPDVPAEGATGVQNRITALKNLAYAAKYERGARKTVGLLISKIGAYYEIEWAFMDFDHAPDAEMDARLADSPIFRPVHEADVDGFLLFSDA
jgi:hypothetical protein